MEKYFAGVDFGTSGCRLSIINQSKEQIKQYNVNYANAEQQTPNLWWESFIELLNQVEPKIKHQLVSLAVDGTSGTILLLDEEGEPSSSVLMYNDLRATDEAEYIKTFLPKDNGGHGASGSLARLLWLLKHEPSSPETPDSTKSVHAHAVHQADFILGKLCNNFNVSDENNCLKLGYDVLNQCWPKEVLATLGMDSSLLPKVYPAGTAVGQIDQQQAQTLGVPENLLCVTGSTDSIAAFIATGAEEVGSAVTSLGSTLVLKLISDKPIFSSEHGIYSHRLNNQWLVGGASNSGAKILQHFFSQQQLDDMTENLQADEPTGLDYYPLLKEGERFPVADAQKQPQLSPRPDSDLLFFQGILEGVARIERQGYAKLTELGAPQVSVVYSVGGGSRNKAWTQIRKNQLGVNMIKPEHTEAAYGSALLAFKGFNNSTIGVIND